MSNYKPYPRYKDSGVEWLGRVPEHWSEKRLRFLVRPINEKVEAISANMPYIGLENIESWTGRLIESEAEADGLSNLFENGDILFGKLRPYLAKVYHAKHRGICTSEALVLRGSELEPGYLCYWILSRDFINTVDSSTYGAKMPRANWEFIGNLITAVPAQQEQIAIADFLDRETARIDALIEKKQCLVELLKEKRQAVITQAVTKGLDPNVPMKDSGVEWLGKMPENWSEKRLRFLVRPINEKVEAVSVNMSYIGLENIESWTGRRIESEVEVEGLSNLFKDGDVLFGKLRPYLAKVYHAKHQGICTSEALVLRGSELEPRYLCYWMLSRDFINAVDSSTYGAKMPRASWEFIGNLIAVVPTQKEQIAITDFLDREIARIDALIEKTEKSVELLKERRSALITAAVTGQIDVRDAA